MNNKKKNILLGVLVVGVLAMTVAFAALATNLTINGTANVAATKWNIHFQNWVKANPETVDGHNNTAVSPAANALTMADNSNVTKVEGINVTLNQPGDTARYTFEIVNEGTIDAKLSNFTPSITNGNNNVIEYTVECKDSKDNSTNIPTGNEITTNSVLSANGGLAYCLLEVKYKDQTNAQTPGQSQVYEQSAINATISAAWTWVQDDGGSSPSPSYTWNNYITPTQKNGGSTLPANTSFYIQQDTTANHSELCGVFGSSTTCLTSDSNGRSSDFADVSSTTNNITTTQALEATGLQGYALTKAQEMLNSGAASCSVYSGFVMCVGSDIKCLMSGNGNVHCSTSDNTPYCDVYGDGSAECN